MFSSARLQENDWRTMRVLKSLFAHKQCQSQETLFTLTDQSGTMNMFSLMVPLFFRQLCTVLLGTISMVILTRVSEEAVTAVSVANTVINIPLNLITMIANGMMIILSLSLGAGLTKNSDNLYVTGVLTALFFSLFLSGVSFVAAYPLLRLMHIEGKILELAVLYFRIRMGFIMFTALTGCITAVLRAYGIAAPTLISGLLENGVNVALSLCVISGNYSGNKVAGVAFAVVIGQLVGLLYSFAAMFYYKVVQQKGRFAISQLWRILCVGIPSGLSLLTYVITAAFSTSVIASLGQTAVNVKVYTATISEYTYLFGYAMAQAGALMISRYVGGGRYAFANRMFHFNVFAVPLLDAMMAFVVFLFTNPLMHLFTDDPDLLAKVRVIFLIDILIETARGQTHVGENSLCNVADTVYTSVVSITSCVLIGACGSWLLCIKCGLGVYGYFIASALDETVRGCLFRLRWHSGRWKASAQRA